MDLALLDQSIEFGNGLDSVPACKTKKATIKALSAEFGRGYFSILNVLNSSGD